LVQKEAASANNGVYLCTVAGAIGTAYVLTRTTDANTSADLIGAFTFIEEGTVNASAGFVCLNNSAITIGTTGVTFTQFSGAGEITAGTGLTKSGNTISADSVLSALDSVMSATATAAAQRTALGLTIGTNVEAWSAVLDALAAVMSSTPTAAAQRMALGLGASSIWNNVVRETPSGSVNGTNTTFTLANTPVSGSEQVFLNGLLQEPGSGNDYTISGATITYLAAPLTGDRLRVTYSH
jgi:hypothetical protein